MATYSYNELDSDEGQRTDSHSTSTNGCGGGDEELTFNLPIISFRLTPSSWRSPSIPPPTLPLLLVDEIRWRAGTGINNWGEIIYPPHMVGTGLSKYCVGSFCRTGTSYMAAGLPATVGEQIWVLYTMNLHQLNRLFPTAVPDDAIAYQKSHGNVDLELPPAHETHWSLPRSQARPTHQRLYRCTDLLL